MSGDIFEVVHISPVMLSTLFSPYFNRGDSQGDLENKMALISIRITESSAKIANIKLNMQSPKEQVTRLEAFKNLTRKNIREEEEDRISR